MARRLEEACQKSRCSVHDYKNNIKISGVIIGESSTLPLDTFVVAMEFLHPRVREYDTFHFCSYIKEFFYHQIDK